MKRRKHMVEDSEAEEDDEPLPKKSRAGAIGKSNESANDNSNGPVFAASKRRPSVIRRVLDIDEHNLAHTQDGGNDEDRCGELENRKESEPEARPSIVTPKKKALKAVSNQALPSSTKPKGNKLFSTPTKVNKYLESNETPQLERNANRSAFRKSTRTLIERTVLGNTSDNSDEDEDIALHIYGEGEDIADEEGLDVETFDLEETPATPSKRGRPKASKARQRSPTPPLEDLPAHEKYFFHNRGGRIKTSDNTLSSLSLLDHEEYFTLARRFDNPHAKDIKSLEDLHVQSFNQWRFELSQDFNLCIYGWGSKRQLLMRFADHIYKSRMDQGNHKIVVVNGYVHSLTVRDILNTVASAVSGPGQKIGSQAGEMLENVISLVEEDVSQDVTVIIHSIDKMPLRRPATQTILARLSAHPQIHLVVSADHPSFALLWDSSLRSTYNFLFHDCTTFQPHTLEIDVVDEVHELLGRSGRRIGGKEGVSFVLKSLPENAKNLFRVLIGEQLATMDDKYGGGIGVDGDANDDDEPRISTRKNTEQGVEYRMLYQKAVEEFICSNEMNFRTLLKEFHDHQMIQSRKDALGMEMLSVPFRKEELETILEDIMS